MLDRAHRGDIEGAFGRVPSFDTARRVSLRRRLGTLLAIAGPGTRSSWPPTTTRAVSPIYAQAGQNHGLTLLWILLLLAPVLYVNQEMVARLGAVTGAGHARLIFERFGRRWGAFAIGDLLVLNFLTIVTEFIGVTSRSATSASAATSRCRSRRRADRCSRSPAASVAGSARCTS